MPVGGTRGRDGARAFNLVHVYPTTVLHSVVPLGAFPALDWIDADESARRLGDVGHRHRGCRDAAGAEGAAVHHADPGARLTAAPRGQAVTVRRVRSGVEDAMAIGRSVAASVAFSHGAGNGK